jgi:CRP-like cAMP-binding protein
LSFSNLFDYPSEEKPLDRMKALVFLPHWGQRDWRKLLERTEVVRFNAGIFVTHQHDTERALYIVTFGTFERLRDNRRLSLVEAGGLMGEQPFLDRQPHPTDIRAVTEGELIRLSYEAYEIFAAREPELARDLLFDVGRIVSVRLRASN